MSYKVYFNEYIRPACIPFDHRHEWKTAIATGFGKTAHGINDDNAIFYSFSTFREQKFFIAVSYRVYGR